MLEHTFVIQNIPNIIENNKLLINLDSLVFHSF
jgi:hypothetical protein